MGELGNVCVIDLKHFAVFRIVRVQGDPSEMLRNWFRSGDLRDLLLQRLGVRDEAIDLRAAICAPAPPLSFSKKYI